MTDSTPPENTDAETHVIQCADVLDIAVADELKATLLKGLETKLPISLVAADVERADTAALQVLVAFFNEAKVQGVTVEWLEPSEGMRESARILGLTNELQLEIKAA